MNSTVHSIYVVMLVAAIGMGLFFVVFFSVLAGVGKKLTKLHKATVEISLGRFTGSIDVEGTDELGLIGKALIDMSSKLKEVHSLINDSIHI